MRNAGIIHHTLFWNGNNGLQCAYFVNNGLQCAYFVNNGLQSAYFVNNGLQSASMNRRFLNIIT